MFLKKQEFQDGGSKMAAVWEQNVIVRHKTSSADVAYLNGNVLDVLSVVIALIFSELRGGGGFRRPKNPGVN